MDICNRIETCLALVFWSKTRGKWKECLFMQPSCTAREGSELLPGLASSTSGGGRQEQDWNTHANWPKHKKAPKKVFLSVGQHKTMSTDIPLQPGSLIGDSKLSLWLACRFDLQTPTTDTYVLIVDLHPGDSLRWVEERGQCTGLFELSILDRITPLGTSWKYRGTILQCLPLACVWNVHL